MLSSKDNASASAALLAHLAQQTNVTVVGEETGGNQGGTTGTVIAFLTLPESGVVVRIPMIRNRYKIKEAQDGMGLIPDIIVRQPFDHWLIEKDSAMAYAKQMHF